VNFQTKFLWILFDLIWFWGLFRIVGLMKTSAFTLKHPNIASK